MPDVVNVMEEFNTALSVRESQQWLEMGGQWKKVQETLQLYIGRLADEIDARRTAGMAVNSSALYKLDRYKDLLKQVKDEARSYETYASRVISGEQSAYGEIGIEAAQAGIRAAGYTAQFNRINTRAIQDMVGITGDGGPLFDLLKKRALAPDMVSGLTNAMIEAVSLGYNPVETAGLMARGLNQGLSKALTIARTEQIRVYRQASFDQYAASGVVDQWQRFAAKSERTCLVCLALDGQIQKVGTLFASHPNCRCYVVPIISGMPYSPRQSGQDWLANKPAEFQQKVLGGYYNLYKNGTPLEKMVNVVEDPTWGPTLRAVPMKDLVTE